MQEVGQRRERLPRDRVRGINPGAKLGTGTARQTITAHPAIGVAAMILHTTKLEYRGDYRLFLEFNKARVAR